MSMSPPPKAKAVHRLPVTKPASDIKSTNNKANTTRNQAKLIPLDNGWPKRDKGHTNGYSTDVCSHIHDSDICSCLTQKISIPSLRKRHMTF